MAKRKHDPAAWEALHREGAPGLTSFQVRIEKLLAEQLEPLGLAIVDREEKHFDGENAEVIVNASIGGTPLGYSLLGTEAFLGGPARDDDCRFEEPDWESPDALGDAFVAEAVQRAGRYQRGEGGEPEAWSSPPRTKEHLIYGTMIVIVLAAVAFVF